jgi:predicted ATP-dependent endonuclease of OLD family
MIDLPGVAVFHVTYDGQQSRITSAVSPSDRFSICVDLGYRASDLLQSNCIIWVEGPTDRIYLRHWLQAEDPELREGVHYSIMFYGGRLLSHLSADDEEIEDFISLRKINQNLVIVIDSDRPKKGHKMNATKRRVRDEFDNGRGFAWVTAGREIENYVPPEIMLDAVQTVYPSAVGLSTTERYEHTYHFVKADGNVKCNGIDKVKIARKVVEFEANLDRFELRRDIQRLSKFIRECNDLPVKKASTGE